MAQMRDSTLTLEQAAVESEGNRMIAAPLKLTDCSQITDGAAAIVLSSQPGKRSMRLAGYGHATDHLPLERKAVPEFPIARKAAKRAFEMARLTPADIQAAEVHDCFSISQLVAMEILGFADDGKAASKIDGPVAINPGGGLIGDGHPVGATGVRQVVEAFAHLTESAGARQVQGAKNYLTFNMGGTMTTSVVTIWNKS
jgi:acetyl-CoA C-acetyltransferase